MTELLFFLLWCGIIHGSFGTNYPSKSNMEVFDFRSPDVPKWSARTSEWNFQFVGTKASIVELARWYKGYYEANKPPLLAGSSRELDTLLGAYAVLWGTTQNPFFSQKYKELILNLSDREFFFSGLSVDPTVGNDFMTSYLWLREQGIFTEDEQKRIEAWMLKLKDAMQFPLQEANWGRLPQLAKALELHFPDEAKAIWKSIPKEGVSFDTRHRWENDAFAYDRIWLKHAYYYARTVRPELIGGANHRKAADWFLAQWTPNGMQPCYGDQTGASLWDANTPEWLAAHALKDGRLKWLAIKILQSALQNNQLREQGAQPALFQLWMNADDSLKPVKPEIGSVALRFPDGSGDKLVFRSGWEDDDAYLLLDLVGTRGHGHVDQNNAAFLLWRGKPWLIDSNYGIASTQEHNVLAIDTLQRAGISQVSVFRDFGPLAIGGAIASNYLSSGFDWERVVLFKNGGPIVIVDRVLAKESGKHDLSLLWHIKGELFHQEARAFSFKQGEESLHLLC
ncbi:MAG: hypothetical protein H8D67_07965 [Deltaproteobacteria bacterium]|nr:hypothetical protein [Deltaproteobacteria bacterium]